MSTTYKTDVADIKNHYPILDVAARYVQKLKRSGRTWTGFCPFHNDTKTPNWVVWPETGTWRCWVCQIGGDVIDLVGYDLKGELWNTRDKIMFREALAALQGMIAPRYQQLHTEHKIKQPPFFSLSLDEKRALEIAARIYHATLLEIGEDEGTPFAYLRQRGFSRELIRSEGLGYVTGRRLAMALVAAGYSREMGEQCHLLSGERGFREFMSGRIIFPDRDRYGNVIHLIGRAYAPFLGPDPIKYLSLRDQDKPLYGYEHLDRRASDTPVIVVESPPDRLTARQWGCDSVSTLGTALKEEHALLLKRLPRPKIIIPHNDDGNTGLKAAMKWKEQIGSPTQIARLPNDVKDLNELGVRPEGKEVLDRLVDEALKRMGDGVIPSDFEPVESNLDPQEQNLWMIR